MADVAVLHYARYMGKDSQSVYSYVDFCGACLRALDGQHGHPYGFPFTPDDLMADQENYAGLGNLYRNDDRSLDHFAFCPWCGAKLVEEWWRDQIIQNERPIDHYINPGHHKGDIHKFRGEGPDCFANHWLSTTGDELCWCSYKVESDLLGCTVRHGDDNYEEVMARRHAEWVLASVEWDDD